MASTKKKIVSTVAAVATAAALLLGGTLAWQSANQVALNEASDVINPGGRLHDDFDGTNKDVYVENFTDPATGDDIFARIRLEEYFEIITNYGKKGAEKVHTIVGSVTATDTDAVYTDNTGVNPIVNLGTYADQTKYQRGYEVFKFDNVVIDDATGTATVPAGVDANSQGYAWWEWQLGGETVYMPTYNMNKDSLMADVNGKFNGAVGSITDKDPADPDGQYTPDEQTEFPYVEYAENEKRYFNEVYDGDPNNIDEIQAQIDLKNMIEGGEVGTYGANVELVPGVEHIAKPTTHSAKIISMADWLALVEADGAYNAADHGGYWVYDTDGWVYWSAPIPAGETTGLLLDGIKLNQVMDDTWYYALNVVAQFVTADDVGRSDLTGFYDTTVGAVPSADAEKLLGLIGVEMDEELPYDLMLTADGANTTTAAVGEDIVLAAENGADLSSVSVYQTVARSVTPLTPDTDYTYDAATKTLNITYTGAAQVQVADATGNYSGYVNIAVEEQTPFNVYRGYGNHKVDDALYYTGSTLFIPLSQVNDWFPISLAADGQADYSLEVKSGFGDYDEEYGSYSGLMVERQSGEFIQPDPDSSGYYEEWVESGPCDMIIIYPTAAGELVISAVDTEGNTHELKVICTYATLSVDDMSAGDFDHVYAGATHTLSFDMATSYELVSTGHQAGTYIDGNTLYVDAAEAAPLTIKVTTTYGEITVDPLTVRGADESKWMLVSDGYWEIDLENAYYGYLYGEDNLSAFYEGEKAYVRLSESDEYTEEITAPAQEEWNDVDFILYANTQADGSGESTQWNLTIHMPY